VGKTVGKTDHRIHEYHKVGAKIDIFWIIDHDHIIMRSQSWVVSQFEIMENKTKYKVIDLPNDGKAIEVDGKLIQGIPIREDNFHLLINELCKMSGTKNYEYQLGDIKYCGNPSSNINSTSL